jgi:hypothetical protein
MNTSRGATAATTVAVSSDARYQTMKFRRLTVRPEAAGGSAVVAIFVLL